MELKLLKKIALFLIIGGAISTASAQVYSSKIGENPFTINSKAALEVESTNRGFLPPRMTKEQRNAITEPPIGLIVWCTDCNKSGGRLCVYLGKTAWAYFEMLTVSLSTGKRTDLNNKPVRISATSAKINGTLVSTSGVPPTETGVVYREITGNDFAVLPVLDNSGTATLPNYKVATAKPVTTDGGAISVTISDLSSVAKPKRPFSFRTYAKDPSGIVVYGNPVIFNCAPPEISNPVVTNGNTLHPTFVGTLTAIAGTLAGAITEYGYCSSTTNSSPTIADNKVILSATTTIAALNTKLDADTFTADPTVDLAVKDYKVTAPGLTYFKYYVTANGETTYSSVVSFTPIKPNPVTGGTAVATLGAIELSKQLKMGEVSTSVFKVHFKVIEAGSYDSFVVLSKTGATQGLTLVNVPAGKFPTTGDHIIGFAITGTPAASPEGNVYDVPIGASLKGNVFNVSRIGNLDTGTIIKGNTVGGNAFCDASHETPVEPVTSKTGAIWMDRNLGASRAALSSDDFQAYGCLYQWGRGNDGHASIKWTSSKSGTPVNGTTTRLSVGDKPENALFIIPSSRWGNDWRSTFYPDITTSKLWQGLSGVNNPCPSGYRVPTNAEFIAETTAYGIINSATAYSSPLKFTKSAFRDFHTGNLSDGSRAFYWSSTPSPTASTSALDFSFDASGADASDSNGYSHGFNVRCIKEIKAPVPVGNAEVTVTSVEKLAATPPLKIGVAGRGTIKVNFNVTKAGSYNSFVPSVALGATTGLSMATVPAGSFAIGNQSLTFIVSGTPGTSLEGNTFNVPGIGTLSTGRITQEDVVAGKAVCDALHETTIVPVTSKTGRVWMDRNLGASRAALSADDFKAYGCLYQWGRSNDGHASINWESATKGWPVNGVTTTLSDGDTPANALFIITTNSGSSWRTTPNNNLWKNSNGVNINNPCPSGYRVPEPVEMQAEIDAYSIYDVDSAFGSPFKFVTAGSRRFNDGSVVGSLPETSPGYSGAIWTTSDYLLFKFVRDRSPLKPISSESQKAFGRSVRCIKDIKDMVSEFTVGSVGTISKPLKIGETSTSTITVLFNVSKLGSCRFEPTLTGGATKGITMPAVGGNFTRIGDGQAVTFTFSGTPSTSLEGNSFTISRIPTPLSTGAILDSDQNPVANCDGSRATPVVEIKSSRTGRVWMDRNLGASRRAIWYNDYMAFGCLYQWGRGNDGHASINWASNTEGTGINGTTKNLSGTDSPPTNAFITPWNDDSSEYDWRYPQNPNLWQGVDGKNNPCPANYRIPTIAEFESEKIPNGKEQEFSSDLKLVGIGIRNFIFGSNGNIAVESQPGFWSSDLGDTTNSNGFPVKKAYRYLTTNNNQAIANGYGCSVRCIKDVPNPITGGTSIATVGTIEPISKPLKTGEASASTIKVHFKVTKAGSYGSFVPSTASGATTGLSMVAVPAGKFIVGDNVLTFTITGTPGTSLDGNTFNVPGIGTLSTGKIMSGVHSALCDSSHHTQVVDVTSKTGRVWMDRNLGAGTNAKSVDYTNKEAVYDTFGCLFQWGRGNDGHASMNWGTDSSGIATGTAVNGTTADLSSSDNPGTSKFIINETAPRDWRSPQKDGLWQGVNGVNNPCPAGYKIPSFAEINDEFAIYGIDNVRKAYDSPLGFTPAGKRYAYGGRVDDVYAQIYIWTGTVERAFANYRSISKDTPYSYRGDGYSVRCIKEINYSVTGGVAEAAVTSVENLAATTPFKIGVGGSGSIKVNFNVTKAGSYDSFVPSAALGATTGLSMATVPAGNFALGNQSLTFTVSGTPGTSLDGNTFTISRIATALSTGKIAPGDMIGGKAVCDALHETAVVPVTSKTGAIWMDRNLGASRQAKSSADYESFGCLYQWGRGNDGHASATWTSATAGTPVNGTTPEQSTTNTPNNALFITGKAEWLSATNTNWQGADGGINNPCPSGYRVPSYAEFTNEKTAYDITNTAKAYESVFKFPKIGIRDYRTGNIFDSRAYYWTSTIGWNNDASLDFIFNDGGVPVNDANLHAYGFGVRCIKKD